MARSVLRDWKCFQTCDLAYRRHCCLVGLMTCSNWVELINCFCLCFCVETSALGIELDCSICFIFSLFLLSSELYLIYGCNRLKSPLLTFSVLSDIWTVAITYRCFPPVLCLTSPHFWLVNFYIPCSQTYWHHSWTRVTFQKRTNTRRILNCKCRRARLVSCS